MKKITILFLLFLSLPVWADEYWVTNNLDPEGVLTRGTLRNAIEWACDSSGSDTIRFDSSVSEVGLETPLLTSRECEGSITIEGEDRVRLNGSGLTGGGSQPGDSCILNVYSGSHTIKNLRFSNNENGAGVCLFGRNNTVESNRFDGNKYGVVISDVFSGEYSSMDGEESRVTDNRIDAGHLNGIWLNADRARIQDNDLTGSTGIGLLLYGDSHNVGENTVTNSGSHGIKVHGNEAVVSENQVTGSQHRGIFVYGDDSQVNQNTVEESGTYGVVIQGDHQANQGANISHNTIRGSGNDGLRIVGNQHRATFNTIEESGGVGILAQGTAIKIEDNTVTDGESYGIRIQGEYSRAWRNNVTGTKTVGLVVEGDHHQSFGNHVEETTGDGLRLYGNDADLREMEFLKNRGHGLKVYGNDNVVAVNRLEGNARHGLWLQGDRNQVTQNQIVGNGGCVSAKQKFPSDDSECLVLKVKSGQFTKVPLGGAGIFIAANSLGTQIGSDSLDPDLANIIQFNHDGGVVIEEDPDNTRHFISINQISKNYGPNIDLGDDGISMNDERDADEGANNLLNFAEHLQFFPLVPSPTGENRYWAWGISSATGDLTQVYQVSEEEIARNVQYGGGDRFVGQVSSSNKVFEILPSMTSSLEEGDWVTLIANHNGWGNSSEFSLNYGVGPDTDFDGILDEFETGADFEASSLENPDSDGDGLPDPLEDKNRNGTFEPDLGDTRAYNADTDGDGLSDWAETHGDGIYHAGIDTDPNNPDTDGDGLWDGLEDSNNNGIWDGYLRESSPLKADSDGDLITDSVDNCPSVSNPGQEPWWSS